jgi:cytochrome c oxidase subunit 2
MELNRLWSLLFLAVPVLGTAVVLGAATGWGFLSGWWLPPSIGPRTASVDGVFHLIHIIIGVLFVGTGLVLAASLFWFSAGRRKAASSRQGNLVLEVVWTVIPAGILVGLVVYQLPYWNANKVEVPIVMDRGGSEGGPGELTPFVRVIARQFDWTFVYPGDDEMFDTRDDFESHGILVLPVDQEVLLELRSDDVIHSFAVNALRLKQDIVPGLGSQVWFRAVQQGDQEIHCAELCGWGHYRMGGLLRTVSWGEFNRWQRSTFLKQNSLDR